MIYSKEVAAKVAENLLKIEAIKLSPTEPFTWSSGWTSPIYCDNRVSLAYPEVRTYIKEQFAYLISRKFPLAEVVGGVATAGIAHGALLADFMQLPFAYVRPEPKKHGMGKQIEGRINKGQKVVLVEDLISTGGSSIKAIKPVQDAGCDVMGVVAIFDYGFKTARDNYEEIGIPYYTLSDYEHLLPQAVQSGVIQQEQVEVLGNWRNDPANWTPQL